MSKTEDLLPREYIFDEVLMEDFAEKMDGFWLFSPKGYKGEAEKVVVFMHGYGAYNPMIYGAWIEHIVRQGSFVIFPRYQKNVFRPGTKKFVDLAAKGVRSGIELLQKRDLLVEDPELHIAAHSYGGVISAALAHDPKAWGIPRPLSLLLCAPGTGPFKGGILENYAGIDTSTLLVTVVTLNDEVVGDKFAYHLFQNAKHLEHFDLLKQLPDAHEDKVLTAHHNECYSLNEKFDTGVRNVTAKRALRISTTDALDHQGYWKLFDALMDCAGHQENCQFAVGGTEQQLSIGIWENNVERQPLVKIRP